MKFSNRISARFKNPGERKKMLLVVTGLLIASGLAALHLFNNSLIHDWSMILAALTAGSEIIRKAWNGITHKQFTIELLVILAASGGLMIGIYWESAAVTSLFLFGGWLEARMLGKTRSTLKTLLDMAPDQAILLMDGREKTVPVAQVQKDDLVFIKPGSKIPVDGTVESGRSAVNESTITGESIPSEKSAGDHVFAGTLNHNGILKVRADQTGADTTLAKIIQRVEDAQQDKAQTQRLIETFARYYTPAIVGLGTLTFVVTQNIELALTLLVVGCPGALVIATPVSVITGIGNAGRKGILIKGGEYLEKTGKITAFAFDKTGTLTAGKPHVTELIPNKGFPHSIFDDERSQTQIVSGKPVQTVLRRDLKQELLYWTAAVESGSEHPIAKAILRETDNVTSLPGPENFEAKTGFGISADVRSRNVLTGNLKLMQNNKIQIPKTIIKQAVQLQNEGKIVIYTAVENHLLGLIAIADVIRLEAKKMVQKLRNSGVKRIVMLTGDVPETAKTVADQIGLDRFYAQMLPDQKLDVVKKMQKNGHIVAMVGDGINDTPAVAHADIGIAMSAGGNDTAIETADIALMTDNLMKIPEAIRISRKTVKNIYQNIGLAMITVIFLIAGIVAGHVHMSGGMLVHELSVFAVILNALRLRWI